MEEALTIVQMYAVSFSGLYLQEIVAFNYQDVPPNNT